MLFPYATEFKLFAPVGMVKAVKLFPLSAVIDSHPSVPTVKNRLLPNVIPDSVSSVVRDPVPDGVEQPLPLSEICIAPSAPLPKNLELPIIWKEIERGNRKDM